MKMKKRIALLCAGVATVSCINFSLAFANNHGDTEWSLGEWSGSRNTNDILTSDRRKTDDSSAYILVQDGNETRSSVTAQLKDDNGNNLFYRGGVCQAVTFSGNTSRYVPNYAYEAGEDWVKIYILQNAQIGYRGCYGKWSPDSI